MLHEVVSVRTRRTINAGDPLVTVFVASRRYFYNVDLEGTTPRAR